MFSQSWISLTPITWYLVMPSGLTNTPAVFQGQENDVFRDFLSWFVYINNILIFSWSMEEHMGHVRQVLASRLDNRLFVKAWKCQFHANPVPFLGLIIQGGSMKADPEKIRAVVEWPNPANRKELQRFSGVRQLEGWSEITVRLRHPSRNSILSM